MSSVASTAAGFSVYSPQAVQNWCVCVCVCNFILDCVNFVSCANGILKAKDVEPNTEQVVRARWKNWWKHY